MNTSCINNACLLEDRLCTVYVENVVPTYHPGVMEAGCDFPCLLTAHFKNISIHIVQLAGRCRLDLKSFMRNSAFICTRVMFFITVISDSKKNKT